MNDKNEESIEDATERVKKKSKNRDKIYDKDIEVPSDMKGVLAGEPDKLLNDIDQKN